MAGAKVGLAVVSLSAVLVAGCAGNYQLVSRGLKPAATGWHKYVTPRQPEGAIEEAVIEVAKARKDAAVSGYDVVFLADDAGTSVQCVDVVTKGVKDDPFAEKEVVRYRVADGKIAAMSDASTEFFVDAQLERAILGAAAKAWSPDPVVLYDDGGRTISIASRPINSCTAKVMIFDGDAVGTPIASKRVALCSL